MNKKLIKAIIFKTITISTAIAAEIVASNLTKKYVDPAVDEFLDDIFVMEKDNKEKDNKDEN